MISLDQDEISLLSKIEPTLKNNFYNISDEEIATIRNYWEREILSVENFDAFAKLDNMLSIINRLEPRVDLNGMPQKYHKSDFEYIMLYLKGQLTQSELGLIEAETMNFTFTPANNGFSTFPPFANEKDKLSTIGFLFSGRLTRNAEELGGASQQIYFLSRIPRLIGTKTFTIKSSALQQLKTFEPYLSDFIDSHSIFKLSETQQLVLLNILADRKSQEILKKNIEELRLKKPDSYYSEVIGEAIFKCVAFTLGKSRHSHQEVINILTTDIHLISSLTDTERNNIFEFMRSDEAFRNNISELMRSDETFRNNISELMRSDKAFRNNISELMRSDETFRNIISELMRSDEAFMSNIFKLIRSDETFKDKVFSGLSTGIKRQYYQFMVEKHTGFKIANTHAREKIKDCLLSIPQELIDLLSLTSTDVKNWQDADIEQKSSHELSKEIDLEEKHTDRNKLKFFARLDENGNFSMGSMNPENGVLISGLKISRSGIMEVGRFDKEGNLVIDADSQENLFNQFKISNPESIEIYTKFIETLKRFDLEDAETGLPIKRDFFFLKEFNGKWFLGKKIDSSKEGFVLSGRGIEKFSGTDDDIKTKISYICPHEDLNPPPPPSKKQPTNSSYANNPVTKTSQFARTSQVARTSQFARTSQVARTSQSESENISVGCCGLFSRLISRIGSVAYRAVNKMPSSNFLVANAYKILRKNFMSSRQS